jgi:hypothetical protein
VAHLLAVVALHTCHCYAVSKWLSKSEATKLTVPRLRTILVHVAEFITVPALHLRDVQRLRALLGHMAFLIAITATAAATTALRAVTREVTDLKSVSQSHLASSGTGNLPSPHLRHSTSVAERGSGHSATLWPDLLYNCQPLVYIMAGN